MAVSHEEFRTALSAFPAGVTIVTSMNAAGEAVGATVSAFIALSLAPPLILVSLKSGTRTAEAIGSHGAFVAHIVDETTAQLAMTFASPTGDKFDGLRSHRTRTGIPALLDCDIRLSCSLHAQHSGGDHTIFIGHVDDVSAPEAGRAQPVAWYGRQFCQLVALSGKT